MIIEQQIAEEAAAGNHDAQMIIISLLLPF